MRAHRLGDILLESGKITPDQLDQAMRAPESKGRPLGEVLRELGYVDDDDIARALAAQLDIPFHELGDDMRLEKEEVKLIPEAMARRFCVIALRREKGSTITLVMKDPLDLHALDTIRSLTSLDVIKGVSTETRIRGVIDRSYTEEAHIERNLREIVDAEVALQKVVPLGRYTNIKTETPAVWIVFMGIASLGQLSGRSGLSKRAGFRRGSCRP